MNWFRDNPIGAALAGTCGLLVLAGIVITWAWTRPISVKPTDTGASADGNLLAQAAANELGPMGKYQVVNDRPVFNESRRPEVVTEEPEEFVVEEEPEVTEAPDVRLTGVVITPEMRIATLTPAGDGEPVVAREGMPLEGEFVGWTVQQVQDRGVRLASARGETLDVELAVHDAMIAEPPKPEPRTPPAEPGAEPGASSQEEQQLSRAEEIRRRIEERREQLRMEAELLEEQQAEEQEAQRNRYQEAIQQMIQGGRSETAEDDDDG